MTPVRVFLTDGRIVPVVQALEDRLAEIESQILSTRILLNNAARMRKARGFSGLLRTLDRLVDAKYAVLREMAR